MKKRILSLALVFSMVLCALCTSLPVIALSTPIVLQYDDYYEITEGMVIVPSNNFVEWDESSRKLHAKGVGSTTITVDGSTTEVTVNKAKINVVLISGQSNAAGEAGTLDGVNPICPDKGNGYYWQNDILDLNTVAMEKANTPTGSAGSQYYNSVGFYPSLAARWYELTGEKVVIIHDPCNGAPISNWATESGITSHTTAVVTKINECLLSLKSNSNFDIVRSGYYWLQGESNASINDLGLSYIQYTTPDEYYNAYMKMHTAYKNALTVANCDTPMCGILSVRTRENLNTWKANEFCGVRTAQQDLANQNADIFMASIITEDWLSPTQDANKFSTKGGAIHYSQNGYNLLGVDAANNMYTAISSGVSQSFDLLAHDGKTRYDENSVINVNDNMRPIGNDNARETGAAQIVVRTLPITDKSSNVTMTVTNDKNEPVVGIIDNNGYIKDTSKITERLNLTVSANGVVKKYVLATTQLELQSKNYYWDFTNTNSANGAVVSAVTGTTNNWIDNDLTYYEPDGSAIKNVSLSSAGLNNSTNGRGWFSLEKEITLKKNEPWTIEWKGAVKNSSTLLAYNKDGSNSLGESLIYLAAGGAQGVDIRNTSNPVSDTKYTLASVIPTSVINDSNAIWYIINDGTGKVTLWTESNGNVTKYNTVTVGGEFTFNGVMGYYLTSSNAFNYAGTMQYLKIYSSAKSLLDSSVAHCDINKDNQVNILDVISLVNHVSKKAYITDESIGDINSDSNINVIDIIALLNQIRSNI